MLTDIAKTELPQETFLLCHPLQAECHICYFEEVAFLFLINPAS
jgi:hypothetical protein